MMDQLGWSELTSRQRDLRLLLLYKIVYNHITVPYTDILVPADVRTRSKHQQKYRHITTQTPVFRNSFFPRTIIDWNKWCWNSRSTISRHAQGTSASKATWALASRSRSLIGAILHRKVCRLPNKTRQASLVDSKKRSCVPGCQITSACLVQTGRNSVWYTIHRANVLFDLNEAKPQWH